VSQLKEGQFSGNLRDIPWLWGITDEWPGLGNLIFSLYNSFNEANSRAYRRANPAK